jgi:hypothetical protein
MVQYFSLITNQSTILLVMVYQPNEQGSVHWCFWIYVCYLQGICGIWDASPWSMPAQNLMCARSTAVVYPGFGTNMTETEISPNFLNLALYKKKIFCHIKLVVHAWSIKYRRNQKLITQFGCTLRDKRFEPN